MSWTLTYTGKKFHPTDLEGHTFDVVDIAHGLSNICRFAGHVEKFYSVAQHSVIVSGVMEAMGYGAQGALEGLLHDATEAYMVDLPMPIKKLPELSGYRDLEARVNSRIMKQFGVLKENPIAVKNADLIALSTEARDLMGNPNDWPSIQGVKPLSIVLIPFTPEQAKIAFLERYLEIVGGLA